MQRLRIDCHGYDSNGPKIAPRPTLRGIEVPTMNDRVELEADGAASTDLFSRGVNAISLTRRVLSPEELLGPRTLYQHLRKLRSERRALICATRDARTFMLDTSCIMAPMTPPCGDILFQAGVKPYSICYSFGRCVALCCPPPIITSHRKGFESSQVDRRVKRAVVCGGRR